MTSTINDQIAHSWGFQAVEGIRFGKKFPTLSRFSIVLLASLLCLGTTQSALAIPLISSENSAIIVAQRPKNQVPSGVVNAVRQDLSRRSNIASEQIKLKSATRQTWPDGCLGLATSEEMCSQALVEGWRVVMSYQKQTWVYRTDGQGRVIRLEN